MTAALRIDTLGGSRPVRHRPVRLCSAAGRQPTAAQVFLRRRLLLVALVLTILGGGVQLVDSMRGDEFERVAVSSHVVRPGDTLWGIAGQLAPDRDRRDVVDELRRSNADLTDSARLAVGQVITVPAGLAGTS
jgi:nucleoid-associated protein YgaU